MINFLRNLKNNLVNKGFPKVLKFYQRFRKQILILIIFGVPIVLALPFPPPPWNSEKLSPKLQQGQPNEIKSYSVPTNVNALGASILSKLLSIKTETMPGYVCIHNNSEAYFDGQKLDPAGFLDGKDGGTISVPLVYNNNPTLMNVPFASTTCKYFGDEEVKAELQNKIGVRSILPFGRPEVQLENGTTTIKVRQYSRSEVIFKMDLWKGYEWKWLIYIKNFLLVLFAWIVILSTVFQVWDKVQKE